MHQRPGALCYVRGAAAGLRGAALVAQARFGAAEAARRPAQGATAARQIWHREVRAARGALDWWQRPLVGKAPPTLRRVVGSDAAVCRAWSRGRRAGGGRGAGSRGSPFAPQSRSEDGVPSPSLLILPSSPRCRRPPFAGSGGWWC